MIWATKASEITKDVNNLPVAYVSQMKEKFVSRAGLEPASPQYYSGVIDRTRPIQGTSFFRDICVFYGSSPTLLTSISCHISSVVTRFCSGYYARLVTWVRILLATRIFLLFERRMSKATGELWMAVVWMEPMRLTIKRPSEKLTYHRAEKEHWAEQLINCGPTRNQLTNQGLAYWPTYRLN